MRASKARATSPKDQVADAVRPADYGTLKELIDRMIACSECDGAQPSGAILVEPAGVLRVSTNTLCGAAPRAPLPQRPPA
ncbi:MAG: hypothetical protein IPK33_18460 [Gemmatimonadetes bacterium]|nr:hypothetical protein [Gemmatimonadota bacterium]MBK8059769.1 hypothetical protein [Gemmatimonadota bacterium]